jgi:hypothetical protein
VQPCGASRPISDRSARNVHRQQNPENSEKIFQAANCMTLNGFHTVCNSLYHRKAIRPEKKLDGSFHSADKHSQVRQNRATQGCDPSGWTWLWQHDLDQRRHRITGSTCAVPPDLFNRHGTRQSRKLCTQHPKPRVFFPENSGKIPYRAV